MGHRRPRAFISALPPTGCVTSGGGVSLSASVFPHLKKMRDLNRASQDCFQAQGSVQTTSDPWRPHKLALQDNPRQTLLPQSLPGESLVSSSRIT